MAKFQVYVTNIGMVCDTDNPIEANAAWGEYIRQSQGKYGRASGEDVAFFREDELIREHVARWSTADDDPRGE